MFPEHFLLGLSLLICLSEHTFGISPTATLLTPKRKKHSLLDREADLAPVPALPRQELASAMREVQRWQVLS